MACFLNVFDRIQQNTKGGVAMISSKSPVYQRLGSGIATYFRSSEREKSIVPSRLQIGVFLLFLALTPLLSLANFNSFQLGSYMDDASYAVLAKSLVFSDTYGLMNAPEQADSTRYPFGFPLMLSIFVRLFPSTPDMLKIISLLATVCNAVLIFLGWPYFSQNRSRWWGLIISILYALSPLVIGHSRMVMSEPAFTTLTLLSLILAEKFLTKDKPQTIPILLSGMVLALMLFTRTIGLVLIAAVAFRIYMIPSDSAIKWKKFLLLLLGGLMFVTFVVALTPVTLHSLLPAEYMDQLENPHQWGQSRIENALLPRFIGAFLEYIQYHLRNAVFPLGGGGSELAFGKRLGIPNLPLVTGSLIGVLIFIGSLSVFKKQGLFPTVLMFEVLYFLVILIWPWRDSRFLYPILPFLFYNLLLGVRIVSQQLNRFRFISSRTSILITDLSLATVIVGLLSMSAYKGISNQSNSLLYVRDLKVGTTWLKENSSQNSLIMAQQPQSIYLYSDRHTIDFPTLELCQSSRQFEDILQTQGVDYIIVAPEMAWHQNGQLTYDRFTTEKILPILGDLYKEHVLEVAYESEADRVIIYQLINH
jgi:hypothetical protein